MQILLRRAAAGLFVLLMVFVSVRPAAGQGEQDALTDPVEPAPLQRQLNRQAPPRQPRVLRTRTVPGGVNTVVELPPIADAYIASERPMQNFGGDALFLGYNFFGDRFGAERILIRFNVNTIPPDAVINSARLRLRLSFSSPPDDQPMGTVLRRLSSDWDEFSVTWDREPQWASVRDSTPVGSARAWYDWAIGDLVAGWVDGSFANHGVEIIGDERVQQRERAFYSRETTTQYAPHLVVDYTVNQDDEPPSVTVEPLPEFVGRSFLVRWAGSDDGESGIDFYDVQYRVDGGEWQEWLEGVTDTSEEFTNGENGRFYEFRARGVDEAGNVEPFGGPEAATTVDNRPPTAFVLGLPDSVPFRNLQLGWTGTDHGGSGIQFFDVRYRIDGGPWILWQEQTLATSATLNTMRDGFYEFEARAVDKLNQVEQFTGIPEAGIIVDAQAPFVQPAVWLPLVVIGGVVN